MRFSAPVQAEGSAPADARPETPLFSTNPGHRSRVVLNLRRTHYDIATDVPACYKLRTIFDELALTL